MRQCKFLRIISFIGLLIFNIDIFAATAGSASYDNLNPQGWHFAIDPYAWMTAVSGDVTSHGYTAHMYIPFSTILQDLQIAAMVHMEGGYGPLSLMLDPLYVRLKDNDINDGIVNDVTLKMTIIDAGMFYKLYTTQPWSRWNQVTSFDVLAGARYFGLDTDIDFIPIPSYSTNMGAGAPIVGGRIWHNFTTKFHFWIRGDVGVGRIDGVNKTWSATTGLAYTVHKNIDIGAAYKVLKLDVTDSGININSLFYGPMVGVSFHW